MTNINIMNVNLNYSVKGQGNTVLLLHGWRQNTEMMQFIQDNLSSRFCVYNIDFPGFGLSSDPPSAWGVEDYTEFLHEFVKHFNIENPILIGHSFGCRVAIRYAVKYDVNKMILTGAAGIKPKRGADYYAKVYGYKAMKKVVNIFGNDSINDKMKNKFGSDDYKNATGIMRETFVKVVNDDVSDILDKVTCPTILIWGENDDAAPIWMGKEMEKKMKDAALIVFENDDHYAYFHQPQRFLAITNEFLKND